MTNHDYSAYTGIGHNSAASLKGEIVELAHKQLAQERVVERLEEDLKTAKEDLRQIVEHELPEKMSELGIPKFETEDGLKIEVKEVVNASISEERRESANKWLDDNGYGGLLKSEVIASFGRDEIEEAKELVENLTEQGYTSVFKRAVHPQTLKAFVREHLSKGKDIPFDVFGVNRFMQSKITIKKEKL
jgi:hypothetical protein